MVVDVLAAVGCGGWSTVRVVHGEVRQAGTEAGWSGWRTGIGRHGGRGGVMAVLLPQRFGRLYLARMYVSPVELWHADRLSATFPAGAWLELGLSRMHTVGAEDEGG